MAAKVRLYSTQFCPFCVRAKNLLKSKQADFDEIDLTDDSETRSRISAETGWQTVPMIFIGDEFVGGCSELYDLESRGLLDGLLAGN